MLDAAGWQQEVYPYNEPGHDADRAGTACRTAAGCASGSSCPGANAAAARLARPASAASRSICSTATTRSTARPTAASPASSTAAAPKCGCCRRSCSASAAGGVVEALRPQIEICHINEGHAAFAVIERARQLRAARRGLGFWEALWATRAGNVFTTHTPVAAGFDRFPPT